MTSRRWTSILILMLAVIFTANISIFAQEDAAPPRVSRLENTKNREPSRQPVPHPPVVVFRTKLRRPFPRHAASPSRRGDHSWQDCAEILRLSFSDSQ